MKSKSKERPLLPKKGDSEHEVIYWGMDAFADDMTLQSKMIPLLRALVHERKVQIQPVCVSGTGAKEQKEAFLESIRERMNHWLESFKLSGMLSPTVLTCPNASSSKGAVDCLLSHATFDGASAIAVTTRANRGLD